MADNMTVLLAKCRKIRLSVVCDMHAPYSGFNFLGILLHHIVAWPSIRQLTHQKSRRSSKGIILSERVKQANLHIAANILLLIYYTAIYTQLENK